VGPQDPKDVTRDLARDLTGMAGELAALKADARHWLTDPEHADLHLRLGNADAAVEAALIEARRQGKDGRGGARRIAPTKGLPSSPHSPAVL
jgi:hypothetical protein